MSKLVRSAPLYLQVLHTLRAEIIEGVLEPGQRVTEASVAERLGVSRTPAREALRLLESEGYLRSLPDGRLFVYRLTVGDLADTYVIRAGLEPMAARLAAMTASPDVLRSIVRIAEDALAASGDLDLDSVVEVNTEFHSSVCEACGNRQMADTLSSIKSRMTRYRGISLQFPVNREVSLQGHVEIAHAIAGRDVDLAGSLVEKHILAAGRRALIAMGIDNEDEARPSVQFLLDPPRV